MAAALQLLAESGPEGFTVRAIARRANVAPMAIYNHFDGKNGLLDAIWTEGFTILQREMAPIGQDPKDELLRSGIAYRKFALEHRSHYTVMFMNRFVGFTPSIAAAYVATRAFQELVNHIHRCQSVGMFPDIAADNLAQMLWAACHGYISLEILDINFAEDRDKTFLQFLSGVERGFDVLAF
jgi:AcrR family transcriptional regulator